MLCFPDLRGNHAHGLIFDPIRRDLTDQMFELPGSRIESGMTTKNKYPKAVFDFVFVLNKPEIESN